MYKLIKILFSTLTILFLVSFGIFIYDAKQFSLSTNVKTEAIIVLTGANGRIAEALTLYYDDMSNYLFIIGVNKQTTIKDIANLYNIQPKNIDHIILENNSIDTITNIHEAVNLLKKHDIKNFRLVTHDYHMRRSMIEFEKLNHDLIIIPHAVRSESFYNMMILREFIKIISRYTFYLCQKKFLSNL